ncbi:MAG TPA: GntR family transcriptional regulator [Candidatus Mediterraneibacter excrementigallinarum]|nr:GntR family transcriptional regulator [Candidatus Mediterraneibacter excrementigallinarum]
MAGKSNVFSQPLTTENVVDRIVKQITDKIICGDLKPGDKLPTEPELCQAFQVGRNSVREAIKILCAYGIVYIKRAEGTFINDRYSQKMLDPMLYGILLQGNFAEDVVLLRKVLDIGILHTVMDTVTEDQLNMLSVHLERLKTLVFAPEPDMEAIFDADVDFHMEITRFTGNEMLYSIYSYVDRITRPSRDHALQIILDKNEKNTFIELHEKIITLIRERQFDEIETTLTNHYQFWSQVI